MTNKINQLQDYSHETSCPFPFLHLRLPIYHHHRILGMKDWMLIGASNFDISRHKDIAPTGESYLKDPLKEGCM